MTSSQHNNNAGVEASSNKQNASNYKGIPTNAHGQAMRLKCSACNATQVRSFHIMWITFWFCFFVWFCTTNIYSTISKDIQLTLQQHTLSSILSIASTIIFRLIISYLCPIFGSRICYIIILLSTSISLISLSLIQSATGYIIIHIFIGIIGASFVVIQYHTTRMFSGKVVGFAQATSAGFGNFGGGCSNFLMPLLINNSSVTWRLYMVILAVILMVLCLICYFGSDDVPKTVSDPDASFIAHAASAETPADWRKKTPDLRDSWFDAACDYRSWILFICYAACFGVELTFYIMATQYFQTQHNLTETISGLLVMVWSSINLFARPIGGYLSDKYDLLTRIRLLFLILLIESFGIILFGVTGRYSLIFAIIFMLMFSICVQFAEGVTFSIVPFIQRKSVGHVIGIVSSGGNVGAIVFILCAFVPFDNAGHTSWIILGCIVMVFSFSALFVKFSEREIHDMSQMLKKTYDLEMLQTNYTLPASVSIVNENGDDKQNDVKK